MRQQSMTDSLFELLPHMQRTLSAKQRVHQRLQLLHFDSRRLHIQGLTTNAPAQTRERIGLANIQQAKYRALRHSDKHENVKQQTPEDAMTQRIQPCQSKQLIRRQPRKSGRPFNN